MSMRFDVTTMAVETPARFAKLVSVVEDVGCDHLWVCDSSLHARDVFAYLAATLAVVALLMGSGPGPAGKRPGDKLKEESI